jgi:hypothetical protein
MGCIHDAFWRPRILYVMRLTGRISAAYDQKEVAYADVHACLRGETE